MEHWRKLVQVVAKLTWVSKGLYLSIFSHSTFARFHRLSLLSSSLGYAFVASFSFITNVCCSNVCNVILCYIFTTTTNATISKTVHYSALHWSWKYIKCTSLLQFFIRAIFSLLLSQSVQAFLFFYYWFTLLLLFWALLVNSMICLHVLCKRMMGKNKFSLLSNFFILHKCNVEYNLVLNFRLSDKEKKSTKMGKNEVKYSMAEGCGA